MAKEQITLNSNQEKELEERWNAWLDNKNTENAQLVVKTLKKFFGEDKFIWNKLLHMNFVKNREECLELKEISRQTTEKILIAA